MASNPVSTVLSGGSASVRRGSGGSMQPEHIEALIKSEVGKMRAEIEKDLDKKLSHIDSRLNKLPGTVTLIGTIVGTVGVAMAILFAFLTWSDSRVDTGWQRSATMAHTLDSIAAQTDQNTKALEDLSNGKANPSRGAGKQQDQ